MHDSSTLYKAGTKAQVSFPISATIGAVENTLNTFFLGVHDIPEVLELDFTQSTFIEVATLIYLISIFEGRRRKNLHTFLRLPESKNARDFLRSWNFPKSLQDAIKINFREAICKDDLKYWGENQKLEDQKYIGKLIRVEGECTYQLPEEFFAISTLRRESGEFETELRPQIAFNEAERWRRDIVKKVFDKVLGGHDSYFRSRIIFESLMNALRHPHARIIQVASRFEGHKKGAQQLRTKGRPGVEQVKSQASHFTVVFWDNGTSITDTLISAMERDETIRSSDVPNLGLKYRLSVQETSGAKGDTKIFSSDFTPNINSPRELVFFSSILPGITRDISGKDHHVHPDMVDAEPFLSKPGMGLYLVVNAAVDVFGGSVAVRTKDLFLNVKRPRKTFKEAHYSVKIRRYSGKSLFAGNMLTIRLPLYEGQPL